ncbi:MAG: hypothetical protein B9S32_16275 [Verrucomicrobia bacterium Tous-C9LFEB]|nr:MAG: hypothetical protein B9S32_16275 [Verrucomicrobia bacterium Tous-C9LFEB]
MSSLSSAVGFVPKTVMLAGLAGILTGLVISSLNQDSLGWSLLRTSALGVFFALAARHLLYQSLRAWLETKMELVAKKAEEAAKGQAAKAGIPAQTK